MHIIRVYGSFPLIRDGRAHHVWGLSAAQAQRGHDITISQPIAEAWPVSVFEIDLVYLKGITGNP